MPVFTVTHRIAGVVRTNKVGVNSTTPDEALEEIKTALAGDHLGVTPTMVEVINVVAPESEKPKASQVVPKSEAKPEPTPEEAPPEPVAAPAAEETPSPPEAEKPKAAHGRKHG